MNVDPGFTLNLSRVRNNKGENTDQYVRSIAKVPPVYIPCQRFLGCSHFVLLKLDFEVGEKLGLNSIFSWKLHLKFSYV